MKAFLGVGLGHSGKAAHIHVNSFFNIVDFHFKCAVQVCDPVGAQQHLKLFALITGHYHAVGAGEGDVKVLYAVDVVFCYAVKPEFLFRGDGRAVFQQVVQGNLEER